MKMAKGIREVRRKKKEKGIRGSDGEEEKEERVVVVEEGEGRTLVVGVRKDGKSRELLTWALVKVALPRDRVVALHVLLDSDAPPPRASSDSGDESDPVLSLAEGFESMLNVYEGFCNLQQIDLTLKICKGSCVKKVLVRETKAFAASKLIVGVDNHDDESGPSVSVAKYCAKKLPRDCAVTAVSNGKVVFNSEEAGGHFRRLSILSLPHLRSRKDSSESVFSGDGDLFCLLPTRDDWWRNADFAQLQEDSNCDGAVTVTDENPSTTDASSKDSCSLCAPISEPPCSNESKEDEVLPLNPVHISEAPSSTSSSFSPTAQQSPEAKAGWPVLRRAKLVINKRSSAPEKLSRMSVVQWALRLPRYALVHPDRKSIKLDFAASAHNSDRESEDIISVGTDSPHARDAIQNVDWKSPKEFESLHEKYSSVCKIFSYEELANATSNFSPDKLIGKGGSSQVYKACLSDGKELAVKILMPSDDALNEFLSELEIITTLHHKNIVSFHGFCIKNNSLALVYDYFSRGSLDGILHGDEERRNVLSWPDRYKVAIGVADALDYLHSGGSAKPVLHKDVKSSNILLSGDFEPQLSDFGLAQWASSSTSHITCNDVAGTFGYLAPEYFIYGKVNEKVDVYAFGVVLLELLTGRKPITTGVEKRQESLVMWAKPILRGGEVEKLVDPFLGNDYDTDQLERMILAASLCIRVSYQCRPEMALVLKLLQGDDEVVSWARSQVGTSEGCDGLDDEVMLAESDIQSHLSLALLEEEDDSLSTSSTEQTVDCTTTNTSLEDYPQGRWSRSSSFN